MTEFETELRKACVNEPEKYKSLRLLFAVHDSLAKFAATKG